MINGRKQIVQRPNLLFLLGQEMWCFISYASIFKMALICTVFTYSPYVSVVKVPYLMDLLSPLRFLAPYVPIQGTVSTPFYSSPSPSEDGCPSNASVFHHSTFSTLQSPDGSPLEECFKTFFHCALYCLMVSLVIYSLKMVVSSHYSITF